MLRIFELFWVFAKIGAFSIGGGYAMLPFIQREIIENHGWMTLQEFSDILAISQITPGPIAINSATFVGYKVSGNVFGSIAATLGVVAPSFIMIILLAAFFAKFYEKKAVQAAFKGIRPAIVGLIGAAAYQVTATSVVDVKGMLIFGAAFGSLFNKRVDPIYVIIGSAIVGIILYR